MEIDKDKQLVREALEGSQAAFNALLTMYWQDIYTFLAAKRLCPEDTEDLCIETFSKAFEKLDTYDENYRFKTWLINIAKNNYVDFIRRNAPLFSLFSRKMLSEDMEAANPDAVAYDTPESEMIHSQALENVAAAMEYLRPAYRQVMRLRYMDDLSVAEISEKMAITPSNVKVILMRGRRLLLKGLE